MNHHPADGPGRDVPRPDATITGAKIALAGTIVAAIIGATATITVALLQHKNSAPPPATPGASSRTAAANPSRPSTPLSTPRLMPAATSTTPATPDGVTYQCTGSAPAGVDITYGPSGSGLEATSLPFTAHDSVNASAKYYRISAQLGGGGEVSCTLTVTDAGQTTTSSGTARGGHKITSSQICADFDRRWDLC